MPIPIPVPPNWQPWIPPPSSPIDPNFVIPGMPGIGSQQGTPGRVGSTVDTTGQVGAVGVVSPNTGATGATPSAPGAPAGPVQRGDWKQFLIWIAALAALWLILTAAQDAGYPGFANGMAGLILFGAILALGPHALTNARLLFT